MSLNDLSVLVTVHNKYRHLSVLFENLKQLIELGAEIIIIDDGSNDGSTQKLIKFHKMMKNAKLKITENMGSAAARNCALSLVTRNYFIFLDADDQIEIDNLLEAMSYINGKDFYIFKFPYYKNSTLKNISSKFLISGKLKSRRDRNKLISGLGYWRYIYTRKLTYKSFRFFPTFSELKGNKFILDDFFWLLLIAGSDLKVKVIQKYPFYRYFNSEDSLASEMQTRVEDYLAQFVLFPFGIKLLLCNCSHIRIDRLWSIKFYINYTNTLIGMLDKKTFVNFYRNTNKIKSASIYCFLVYLFMIFTTVPVWSIKRLKMNIAKRIK